MSAAVRIGLCQGEPGGCGADLWAAVLHEVDQNAARAEFIYIGDAELLQQRSAQLGAEVQLHPAQAEDAAVLRQRGCAGLAEVSLSHPAKVGEADPACQAQVLDCLNLGIRWCQSGALDALVTAPVQKAAIRQAGFDFVGQTEWLAERAGNCQPLMSFIADELKVALATTHLPLSQVPVALSEEGLLQAMRTLNLGLRRWFGTRQPRLLLCGLNPHAGEQGELGSEERDIIAPAIARARQEGIDAFGPLPADTAFVPQSLERADAVLAMYHDQALPLLKHRFFDQAVNLTLGLPFVRTSPDHGTALDIAGSGLVRPESMLAAVRLAVQLAHHRTTAR